MMQQAEDILSALKKRMPKHAFGVPSEEETWFLPTGSLLLDLSIRDGKTPSGLPGGRLTEMYGLPSAGKTALALRCCKETQKLGGMVVWLDAERGFEPSLAQVIGVDISPEKFIYTEPYGLEHVLGAVEEITEKYHDSPNPITVVVDSVSGLNPMAYMMDDSAVKDTPPAAATAKELHRWFRRGAFWYASGSKITLIFISHLTADPRPYGGDKTPHGSAVSFYSRLRLRMSASDLKDPEGGKRLGQWLTARIVKNKMGSKYAEAEMPFYFHTGFNEATENICYLIQQKKLDKTGNGRVVFGDKSYYSHQLRDLYMKDAHVRETLEQMVRDTFRQDLEARLK
jgi:recombination protein RecA